MQLWMSLHRGNKESPWDQGKRAQAGYQERTEKISNCPTCLESPPVGTLGQGCGVDRGGKQHYTTHKGSSLHPPHRHRKVDEQRQRHHNIRLLDGSYEPCYDFGKCSIKLHIRTNEVVRSWSNLEAKVESVAEAKEAGANAEAKQKLMIKGQKLNSLVFSLVSRPGPSEKEGPSMFAHVLEILGKSWTTLLYPYNHDVKLWISLIGPHIFPGSNNGVQLQSHTVLRPPEAW